MRAANILLVLAISAFACVPRSETSPADAQAFASVEVADCVDRAPLRNLYFGDLHVHTARSFDAYLYDTRATPDDAYRFARGEAILAAPLDVQGEPTRVARIDRPLDFTAVTDHVEFLAESAVCTDSIWPGYETEACRVFRGSEGEGDADADGILMRRLRLLLGGYSGKPNPEVCGADAALCRRAEASVWREIQDAAARAYDRCDFTSFVAYEYSATPNISNLHRNVIFRGSEVAAPISSQQAHTPLELWRGLREHCLEAGTGCDVLAIPHNSNKSNGRMFMVEYPGAESPGEQAEQARLRQQIEPLVEIMQHKGDSECRENMYGVMGSPDELCAFEKLRTPDAEDCGAGVGENGMMDKGCVGRLGFARYALIEGLREAERIGVNPYKLGIIASTDTHNATPGAVAEWDYAGQLGGTDASLSRVIDRHSPGGLVAVWAEENSREALFDAMRRRETFGTSGPRLAVRLFGGWDYPDTLCDDPDLVARGYAEGVPMGGDLAPRGDRSGAPRFAVSATRDPGTPEHPGTSLQRIQIIKGWADAAGAYHQDIYDVAGSAEDPAGVDPDTCAASGPVRDALCSVWTDPDFDPEQRAVYYARVLEAPSCRYQRWICASLPEAERPPGCSDPAFPSTVQERAWTSPIWYEPDR